MAQSVSNDALWQKLSEIDKKLEEVATMQKSLVPMSKQIDNKSDFKEAKGEIITKIKEQASLLGKHSDINFEANKKNIRIVNNNILMALKSLGEVRKHQTESSESAKLQQKDNENYLNFKLFKVKKTFLIIKALGLMVFILTIFCMKQQNDYSLLNDELYKKNIAVQRLHLEKDSLKNLIKKPIVEKSRK